MPGREGISPEVYDHSTCVYRQGCDAEEEEAREAGSRRGKREEQGVSVRPSVGPSPLVTASEPWLHPVEEPQAEAGGQRFVGTPTGKSRDARCGDARLGVWGPFPAACESEVGQDLRLLHSQSQ